MEEHKAEGKQAEDEGVFFRFGDDLAVDDNSHRAIGLRRKTSIPHSPTIIEGSRKEVADGFVDNAGAHPSRRIPAGIAQTAPGDPNPYDISKKSTSVIQEKIGNGSVSAGNSDGRRVSGVGGKGDIGSAAARNSGSHRSDVSGVGTGKQGRQRDRLVVGLIGIVKVVVRRRKSPRVSRGVVSGGSDVPVVLRGGRAAKNPKGLVGGIVLAGIDVDDQLRLGFVPPPPRKGRRRPLRKRISASY